MPEVSLLLLGKDKRETVRNITWTKYFFTVRSEAKETFVMEDPVPGMLQLHNGLSQTWHSDEDIFFQHSLLREENLCVAAFHFLGRAASRSREAIRVALQSLSLSWTSPDPPLLPLSKKSR